MSKFSDIGFSDARRLLTDHTPQWFDEVLDFVCGEHFGKGKYWIGPQLDSEIDTSNDVLNNIERGFIYSNKINEVINRHLDALITEDPDYDFVPVVELDEIPQNLQDLIDLANRLREEFFERNHMDTVVQQLGRDLLWATRSSLRVFVPSGQLDAYNSEGTLVDPDDQDVAWRVFPQEDIEDAMQRLSIHHPSVYDAICLQDTSTSRWVCIYRYRETAAISENVTQPVSTQSASAVNEDKGVERLEISFIVEAENGEKVTVINVLDQSGDTASSRIRQVIDTIEGMASEEPDEGEDQEARQRLIVLNPATKSISGQDVGFTIKTSGVLPMIEVFRDRFVNEAMIQQQKSLNLAMTMVPRNITLAGFLERVITNGMPPGEYETGTYDANGNFTPNPAGKAVRFVPAPHTIGPATLNFYQGIRTTDPTGKVALTTPGVHYKDPIDPANIVNSKVAMYTSILEEARQLHVLTQGDGSISGVSRQQARAEFNNSLSATVRQLVRALEWACIAPLKLAAALSGSPGMFDEIKPQVKLHLNLGPLTSEERESIIKQYEAGLLSRETALHMLGSRNIDVEIQRLTEDPVKALDLLMKQVEVATSMVEAGVDFAVIGELVGLDPAVVERMFDATNNIIEQ